MEFYNYMEDLVVETLEELLSKRTDVCKCKICVLDIATLALNKLPPKYVVTQRGRVYTKLSELELQLKVDVIKGLTQAIEVVKNNPRH